MITRSEMSGNRFGVIAVDNRPAISLSHTLNDQPVSPIQRRPHLLHEMQYMRLEEGHVKRCLMKNCDFGVEFLNEFVHSSLQQNCSEPNGTFPCGIGQCKTYVFIHRFRHCYFGSKITVFHQAPFHMWG